ncbi:hypothetical protein CNECB9_5360050 [Cupriavidus necator]|uniref:Uncharacterized protein n=1 Tax=Cupriavidus necator TaxID=106590 RepID=A0A1K0JXD4_CUPNE|nr:hypothetical protein CNECB9_5360050 [Cupriavidus necator]
MPPLYQRACTAPGRPQAFAFACARKHDHPPGPCLSEVRVKGLHRIEFHDSLKAMNVPSPFKHYGKSYDFRIKIWFRSQREICRSRATNRRAGFTRSQEDFTSVRLSVGP